MATSSDTQRMKQAQGEVWDPYEVENLRVSRKNEKETATLSSHSFGKTVDSMASETRSSVERNQNKSSSPNDTKLKKLRDSREQDEIDYTRKLQNFDEKIKMLSKKVKGRGSSVPHNNRKNPSRAKKIFCYMNPKSTENSFNTPVKSSSKSVKTLHRSRQNPTYTTTAATSIQGTRSASSSHKKFNSAKRLEMSPGSGNKALNSSLFDKRSQNINKTLSSTASTQGTTSSLFRKFMAIHSNDDNPSSDSFTNGPYGTETITTTATAKNLWRIHGEAEYEAAPGTYDLPHLFNTKQAQSGRNTLTKAPCFSMGRATKFYDYQREKEQELRSSLSPPRERSNIEDPLNQSVYDFRQPRRWVVGCGVFRLDDWVGIID